MPSLSNFALVAIAVQSAYAAATPSGSVCPMSHGSVSTTVQGTKFDMECDIAFTGASMGLSTKEKSVDECMASCEASCECTAVNYCEQTGCEMLSSVTGKTDYIGKTCGQRMTTPDQCQKPAGNAPPAYGNEAPSYSAPQPSSTAPVYKSSESVPVYQTASSKPPAFGPGYLTTPVPTYLTVSSTESVPAETPVPYVSSSTPAETPIPYSSSTAEVTIQTSLPHAPGPQSPPAVYSTHSKPAETPVPYVSSSSKPVETTPAPYVSSSSTAEVTIQTSLPHAPGPQSPPAVYSTQSKPAPYVPNAPGPQSPPAVYSTHSKPAETPVPYVPNAPGPQSPPAVYSTQSKPAETPVPYVPNAPGPQSPPAETPVPYVPSSSTPAQTPVPYVPSSNKPESPAPTPVSPPGYTAPAGSKSTKVIVSTETETETKTEVETSSAPGGVPTTWTETSIKTHETTWTSTIPYTGPPQYVTISYASGYGPYTPPAAQTTAPAAPQGCPAPANMGKPKSSAPAAAPSVAPSAIPSYPASKGGNSTSPIASSSKPVVYVTPVPSSMSKAYGPKSTAYVMPVPASSAGAYMPSGSAQPSGPAPYKGAASVNSFSMISMIFAGAAAVLLL